MKKKSMEVSIKEKISYKISTKDSQETDQIKS